MRVTHDFTSRRVVTAGAPSELHDQSLTQLEASHRLVLHRIGALLDIDERIEKLRQSTLVGSPA